jgi:molybdopterin synthase sulfur carrier subunit
MPLIKLYANLRKLAGTKEMAITGATVESVLNELRQQSPQVGDAILQAGELRPHVVVTVNGHNVTDLETPLTEEDTVAIFPPIAGG